MKNYCSSCHNETIHLIKREYRIEHRDDYYCNDLYFIVECASFICKCGERLSDFESPNDIEFRVYSDREWDSILENDAIETWKIPFPKHSAWKCPKCERLYIFKEGNNEAIKVYRLED